jgi:hypothetical protein
MLIVLLLWLVGQPAAQSAAQPAAIDTAQLTLSAPTAIVEIDGGKLKGSPIRLSWGDNTFFLRSASSDKFGNELGRNYLIPAAGGALVVTDEEPPWALIYWGWKAGGAAPGVADLRFEVERQEKNKTTTGSTGQDFGGAGGGTANPNRSDPSQSQISKDLGSMQRIVTTTVRLKGQVIFEVQNKPIMPGLMFSWAPAPLGALAYADDKGRLVIMDRLGHKIEVPGTSGVVLPAWSPDGKRIAYLQKKEKKKYALTVVEVGPAGR